MPDTDQVYPGDGTLVQRPRVSAFQGPTSSPTPWFVRPRQLATYTALYRLVARPYALLNVFGAAGRKQYATIHHAATALKAVKLRQVRVAIESSSVASILTLDLVRITTAPATGNPAVTPTSADASDTAAEATCLALPTTAGTEGGVFASAEWNLGITGSASVINPPPPLNYLDLWIDPYEDEEKPATIRPGVLEGFAVTVDSSVASTVKGFVIIRFTEE